MVRDDDEIHAIQVVHQHLQPGERVSLFGRCRLKGDASRNVFRLFLCLLGPILVCAVLQMHALVEIIMAFTVVCALIILAMAFYGRPYGFCALTDRRLIQWEDGGLHEVAPRIDVREIVGTDNRVTLVISIEKKGATDTQRRLGRSKIFQRIELMPRQSFFEAVGGKELLIDTTVG